MVYSVRDKSMVIASRIILQAFGRAVSRNSWPLCFKDVITKSRGSSTLHTVVRVLRCLVLNSFDMRSSPN